MHHGADAKCTYRFQFCVIFCLHIPCHILITVLNACPDIIKAICPDTVFITIFPFMTARCDWLIFIIYKYYFDPGRTKFNTKRCFVSENRCFASAAPIFYVPPCFLLFMITDHSTIYNHILFVHQYYCIFIVLPWKFYGFNILFIVLTRPSQAVNFSLICSLLY